MAPPPDDAIRLRPRRGRDQPGDSRWFASSRIGLCAVLALGLAVSVAWLIVRGETWTFSFTQEQLQQAASQRFPIHDRRLLLVGFHYENPRVRLTDGSEEIGIGLDARLDGLVNGREVAGGIDVVAKIAYDASTATFVLHGARLEHLDVAGVPDDLMARLVPAANDLAAREVSGIPIYRLRATDVGTALARLVLRSVSVVDGVLHVEVGL